MTTKTCYKLIDLGIKNLVLNQITNELPAKTKALAKEMPTSKTEIDLVTKKELAIRLKTHPSSINRRMKDGMPHFKRGGVGKVYYDFNKVIKWMEGANNGR